MYENAIAQCLFWLKHWPSICGGYVNQSRPQALPSSVRAGRQKSLRSQRYHSANTSTVKTWITADNTIMKKDTIFIYCIFLSLLDCHKTFFAQLKYWYPYTDFLQLVPVLWPWTDGTKNQSTTNLHRITYCLQVV